MTQAVPTIQRYACAQVAESTGTVTALYDDSPQLLSFLLRMLSEGWQLATLKVGCNWPPSRWAALHEMPIFGLQKMYHGKA